MGIHDLWLALTPARQTRTLTELAIREGFEPSRRPGRCLKIAIDSSIWMSQAQNSITYKPGAGTQKGENPALRILFYRLCRLLSLLIIPIFVFDGPDRPSVKRGVQVKSKTPHGLSGGFKAFIEAFGFYWYEAPGEADAELGTLSKCNFVDAVMSEDSDVMVYSAQTVIRMENTKKTGDLVNIFNSQKIATNPGVNLSHEGLFFMAILCSGDYDTTGLPGCGWKTAMLLSRTPLAKSLYVAASTSSSREDLRNFLGGWRLDFSKLLTKDPHGHLGRHYPTLAKAAQDHGFPSVNTILLYAQPITSWTNQNIPNASSWKLSEPDLPKIATLSEKYFSWQSDGKSLVNRFKGNVWPGVVIRFFLLLPSLHDQLVLYAQDKSVPGNHFAHADILCIQHAKIGPGGPASHSNVAGYTIKISTATLLQSTWMNFEDDIQPTTKAMVWIPGPILSAVLPTMVKAFQSRRGHSGNQHDHSIVYSPVLQPLSNLDGLIPLEPSRHSMPAVAGPGPSTLAARNENLTWSGHGTSKCDPIVLSDVDSSGDPSTEDGPNNMDENQASDDLEPTDPSLILPNGNVFLGFIDLC